MKHYIDKDALIAEIEKRLKEYQESGDAYYIPAKRELKEILFFIDTLEVKEKANEKTDWSPSKEQMESLYDLLMYNIGMFDYKKFMEVNSLYEDLTKILNYETNRQK